MLSHYPFRAQLDEELHAQQQHGQIVQLPQHWDEVRDQIPGQENVRQRQSRDDALQDRRDATIAQEAPDQSELAQYVGPIGGARFGFVVSHFTDCS
jgi:hypothetical protein